MYIIRGTARAKRGHSSKVVRMLKENIKSLDANVNSRIYIAVFGDHDLVAAEVEFDTMQAATAFQEKIFVDSWEAELTEGGWYDVTTGNVIELWKVVS